jgi:hypothetical protein
MASHSHSPDVTRFLLNPGRQYEESVELLESSDSIKEEKVEAWAARGALAELSELSLARSLHVDQLNTASILSQCEERCGIVFVNKKLLGYIHEPLMIGRAAAVLSSH